MNPPVSNLFANGSRVLPVYNNWLHNLQQQFITSSAAPPKQQVPIEENPHYSKYADKIKKAQLQKKILPADEVKKESVGESKCTKVPDEVKVKLDDQPKPSAIPTINKRSLENIVKLELLSDKSVEEITEIWSLYHSKRDCIYAIIPVDKYDPFFANSIKYPNFILPLPRTGTEGDAFEFFLLEFKEHSCYFTSLAAYHLHKEMAPVSLTIYYYPELRASKNIVLMMGEFDSNTLNIVECQCLANQLQNYYGGTDPCLSMSLHLFNKDSKHFDHMRLIHHLQSGLVSTDLVNLKEQD